MKRVLSVLAACLLIQTLHSLKDYEDDQDDDYETKALMERTLLFRQDQSQDWEVLGDIQIIRDYTKAQEVVAIKEIMKLPAIRSSNKPSEWLFFKIDQKCGKNGESRALLSSLPTSVAVQSDYKLALYLALETEECLEGLSVGVSGKQRRGAFKNRIFLDTKLTKSTFAKSPVFLHKKYNDNGIPKQEARPQEEASSSQGSFLQRNWWLILIGIVVYSLMSAPGAQQQAQG